MGESIRIITLELAIRFLNDYINGDTYFKTNYDKHNLDRARNQLKLVQDIEYKFDESWNNTEYTIRNTENVEGEIIEKQVMWYFGKDKDNTDFRFMIRIHKNQKLEDVLKEDSEYIDKEVAGIQYKALKTDEASEYVYYTEHNDDVYEIRNAGTISLWWTNRSDESRTAFDTFLNSISFKK